MNRLFIAPERQNEWNLLAVMNFFLGGTAAGFYFLHWLNLNLAATRAIPSSLKLIAPALVGMGFLGLLFEAGRPLRGFYAFKKIRSSWMSKELFFGILFIMAAVYDFLYPDVLVRTTGAVSALLFAFSQSMVLYKARGISGWNMPLLPLLIFNCSIVKGAGLMLLIYGMDLLRPAGPVLWIIFISFISDFLFWFLYLGYLNEEFRESVKALRRFGSMLLVLGAGHVIPVLIISALLLKKGGYEHYAFIAGILALSGALAGDAGILLRAGAYRAIRAGEPKSILVESGEESKCRIIPIESAKRKSISK